VKRLSWMLVIILAASGFYTWAAPPLQAQENEILFDDFNYTAYDDPLLDGHGWIVREAPGWPGVPGAVWRAEDVAFVEDPDDTGNSLLQMTSSTGDDGTFQTQICHQRKYYEGTYAARVLFTDQPASGPDGDQVVQTFYLISPQEYDLDPNYSEIDWEYLPNGGWGMSDHVIFATTWETFRLDPWLAENESDSMPVSLAGWHTLVIQVADEEVTTYIDGELFAIHGDEYYPEVPMSINFNHWFINGGLIHSDEQRDYVEQVDWVFFASNTVLTPEEIDTNVAALREAGIAFTDTVPDWDPPLESPCNF
jgi:hypothetical protein